MVEVRLVSARIVDPVWFSGRRVKVVVADTLAPWLDLSSGSLKYMAVVVDGYIGCYGKVVIVDLDNLLSILPGNVAERVKRKIHEILWKKIKDQAEESNLQYAIEEFFTKVIK